MRKWKKYKGRALAVVLAAALAGGAVTVPGVLAEKTEESSDSDDPGEDGKARNGPGRHQGLPDDLQIWHAAARWSWHRLRASDHAPVRRAECT